MSASLGRESARRGLVSARVDEAAAAATARRVTYLYLGTTMVLFLAMGLFGLLMRSAQAGWIPLSAQQFYAVMTLHGTGMISASLLGTMAALWYVVQPAVRLDPATMLCGYLIALAGVLCVAVSVLGGFATGWSFLYPLPFYGWWPAWSTALYMLGLLLVGISFGLFCLTLLIQTIQAYGSLSNALAIPVALGRVGGHGHGSDPAPGAASSASSPPAIPPPPVLIATVTALQGLVIVAAGTVIGIGLLGHLADFSVGLDPLWAKNITFFFGHSIANITLYLALGLVYALLPRYAGRPWPTNRVVAVAWLGVLAFVLPAFFHHLYMDFAQPRALDIAGESFTYAAVTGALVVTIFGAMLLVWRSALRWTMGSLLLYCGFSGWLIGGIAAALDAFIPFNFRLHNTLWVPGHFHTYFLLGVMVFLFGLVTYLLEEASGAVTSPRVRVLAVGALFLGGYGLVAMWLLGGLLGLPRRYAVQAPGGATVAGIAVIFVVIIAAGLLTMLGEWGRLIRLARRRQQAMRAGLQPLDETLLRQAGFHRVS